MRSNTSGSFVRAMSLSRQLPPAARWSAKRQRRQYPNPLIEHDPPELSYTRLMASESKSHLHTVNAVIVIEFRFINNLLYDCRKNLTPCQVY